jgi:hypothetical protein
MAQTITLNYSSTTTVIPILLEKGLTRAEHFSMYPEIVNQSLDGSKETQYKAFIRKSTIRTEPLTAAQLIAWVGWCQDNDRTIDYDIDGVTETDIVLIPESEQEVQWYDDFKFTPYLEVNMDEGIARTWASLPSSWSS